MAALDTAVTPLTGAVGVGVNNALKSVDRVIDFSDTNLASGDWFKLFTLPAGSVIVQAALDVLTGEGATATVTLGITGTLNALSTALSIETTGYTRVSTVKDYIVLSATPDIVVAADHAMDAAVVRFRLLYWDNSGMATAA